MDAGPIITGVACQMRAEPLRPGRVSAGIGRGSPVAAMPIGGTAFKMVTPPIILSEHGDLSFFGSTEDAARHVEPIDVRNGEYTTYDSEGRLLQWTMHQEQRPALLGLFRRAHTHCVVTVAEENPQHPQDLRDLLVGWLQKHALPIPQPPPPLAALIAHARAAQRPGRGVPFNKDGAL